MNKEYFLGLGLTEEQAEAAVAKHQESISGINSKKEELLAELKTAKEIKNSSMSELEQLRILKQQVEIDEKEAKKQYDSALELQKENISKRTKELEIELQKKDQTLRTYLVDNGLDSELDKAGVDTKYKKAVKSLLSGSLNVKDGVAVTDDGKSLSDFVKEWAESDDGSAFVITQNSGGGGQSSLRGQSGSAAGKSFGEMNLDEKGKLFKENPTEFARQKKEYLASQ